MQRIFRVRPAAHLSLLLLGMTVRTQAGVPAIPVFTGDVLFTNQVQRGNIFTVGETVQIEADVQRGDRVDWCVTDWEGTQRSAGNAAVKDGKVRFAPAATGKGYYSVFVAVQGGQTGRTAYAVVPAVDLAGMADSKFGVQTHFAQSMPLDFLPLLTKAGIMHVRDEQYWGHVEREPGTFDFSHFEGYMAALQKQGVHPLICMSFGNPLYDKQKGPNGKPLPDYKLAPWNPALYDAYGNYCVAVLKRYGAQVDTAEIWNEYNGGTFIAGEAAKNKFKTYTDMIHVVYRKIKAARPDVTVLGAATVKIPLPYLEKLFKQGALDDMDAVAVHPYMSPDEAERSLAALVAMMKTFNHGKAKPIWCTEYGFATDKTPERLEAAKHLVRMSTCLLTQSEVRRMYWYLARDYAAQGFASMGIIHEQNDPMGPLTPVMAYPAYANFISLLHHATFLQRAKTDVRTRLYAFEKEKQQLWIGWSMFETANLQITTRKPVALIDLVGGEKTLTPVDGRVTVTVDETPVYILADKGAAASVAEMPRRDTMIADSESEFGGPDVTNAWSYLYCGNNKTGTAPYDPGQAIHMTWKPSPGDWADTWAGPGEWFNHSAGAGQPGVIAGGQGWAIRRWTSTVDGPIHVLAKLTTSVQGDGCGFKVFLDSRELYNKLLPVKAKDTIDLALTVTKGARLDFVATPGPATDTSYDVAGFRIQILTVAK